MILPDSRAELLRRVIQVKEQCRSSAASRAALAREQSLWIQSGRASGSRSLVNKLYPHIDRLTAHLFSPAELAFILDFESYYDAPVLSRASMAARILTREWERKDADLAFGEGVNVSLQYGSAILKQMWGHSGFDARLIMPWQFGVYREDLNDIDGQEAICESGLMTLEDTWRRISHLPDAAALYKRIAAHARRDSGDELNTSFFHNVLSTTVLNTDLNNVRQQPGGVVQLSGNPAMAQMGPDNQLDMVQYHEMYLLDDARGDYTTVLLIEPDVLVSPYFKRENMFSPQRHPYSIIQANAVPGYFWGRSEIVDLMAPQGLLSTTMDDIKRLMGIQFDKLLAFSGNEGITDEKYNTFRTGGYVDLGPGGSVTDLTPQLPPQSFAFIELIDRQMEEISGFSNILSGRGESGVRSGGQTDMLMRNASPRLRDRSLLIERQCASSADKTLSLLQSKDATVYYPNPESRKSGNGFILHDLPPDRRVTVDSHSSSPIFKNDHGQLMSLGLKAGYITGESAIEMLPYPKKDTLLLRLQQKEAAQAKLIQEHPEILAKQKGRR